MRMSVISVLNRYKDARILAKNAGINWLVFWKQRLAAKLVAGPDGENVLRIFDVE